MVFKRHHHQHIAHLLCALDGDFLLEHQCFFGGGTLITLRYGEYRESVDVDFLVSDLACYRSLRQLVRSSGDLSALLRGDTTLFSIAQPVCADQYGIRTAVNVAGEQVKFEIVLEGRIELDSPGPQDRLCGVPTLTRLDMATSKLLANSDRWIDASVFSRDLIDLAMMQAPIPLLRQAVAKAERAYGSSILKDLGKAIDRLEDQSGLLGRCMQAMSVEVPRAVLWQKVRRLRRLLVDKNDDP
ncbi:MAG: nucleotidyl transferase AbiEii/AbiGii toxin family protein [Chromatocurvus sp.]